MTAPPGSTTARLDVVVRGRVQGVGYRYFALATATSLGLTGWVANQGDGSVRCVAEGARPALEQLASELARGPFGARIDTVEAVWGIPAGTFTRFEVRSGSHSGD